jgi:lipoate-protein ligase A
MASRVSYLQVMFLERLCCIDDPEPRPAALNMAVDEALLLSATMPAPAGGDTALPVLRRYRWQRQSVSLGYFSRYDGVAARYPGWDIVRRWTGGGVVEHAGDFSYSLILPLEISASRSNEVIYQAVHVAIAGGLRRFGLAVDQVSEPDPVASDACFARAVVADLRSQERKIAGAAIRRHRRGLLLQGSVQGVMTPPGLLEAFANGLAGEVRWEKISLAVMQAAEGVAAAKYALRTWTERF